MDTELADIGSGHIAHVIHAEGGFHELGYIVGAAQADFVEAVGIQGVFGDQGLKVLAVGQTLVDLIDLFLIGSQNGGLGVVQIGLGVGHFGGFLAFGSAFFQLSLNVQVFLHQAFIHAQQDVLDAAETFGAVPGIIHGLAAVVHGVHIVHIHVAVVGHIGVDVILVERLVLGYQRLILGFHVCIGDGHILGHLLIQAIQHHGLGVVVVHIVLGEALLFQIGNGLLTAGGSGAVLGSQHGHIVSHVLFPDSIGFSGSGSQVFLAQGSQTQLGGLLHEQLLVEGILSSHRLEGLHILFQRHIVVCAVLAHKAVIIGLGIGPGDGFAIDGQQHIGIVQTGVVCGGADHGDLFGGGFLSSRHGSGQSVHRLGSLLAGGQTQHQAQAHQQGDQLFRHDKQRSFRYGCG